MKRLIYITYLGLLVFMMMACEKEAIVPTADGNAASADNRRITACTNYSYQAKTGTVHLGTVRNDVIMVVFYPQVTPAQQADILGQYNIFESISSTMFNDSGEEIQIVDLKPNANCNNVETMLSTLGNNPQVKYAKPAFTAPPNTGVLWLGLTSEFIVTLVNPNHSARLQKLASQTNTKIIDDWGNGTYLMGTTNSSGDALAMSTYFNQNQIISIAEPNFILQYAPFKYQNQSEVRKAEMLAAN